MFILCHFNTNPSQFILYSKEEMNTEEMGIIVDENLTLNQYYLFDNKAYNNLSVINYEDLLIKVLVPKTKTKSHSLALIGIESLNELTMANSLIEAKISPLSRSERKLVTERYQEIIDLK